MSLLRRQGTKSLYGGLKLLVARLTTYLIPSACPFERKFLFLRRNFYIPPLCKFNPFYTLLIHWRLKAMVYLSNQ